jgi:hypothetical protein
VPSVTKSKSISVSLEITRTGCKSTVGTALGVGDGTVLGTALGVGDGTSLGLMLGFVVGSKLGCDDGVLLGIELGMPLVVGSSLGLKDEDGELVALGMLLGIWDGTLLGQSGTLSIKANSLFKSSFVSVKLSWVNSTSSII